jgi:hypothetical protein
MQAVAINEGTYDKQASVPMMTPEYIQYPGYMSPTTGSTPPGALAMESPNSPEQSVWNRGQQFGTQWPTQWPKQDKEIKLPEWSFLMAAKSLATVLVHSVK